MEIIHIVGVEQYQAGDIIFSEGDAGDAWFLLYSGVVEVLKQGAWCEQTGQQQYCFNEQTLLYLCLQSPGAEMVHRLICNQYHKNCH